MILEKLCRAHFDKYGMYDQRSISFMSMLEEHARTNSLSVEESYYVNVGYKHDDALSSVDRFTFRKMFVEGKKSELQRIFKVKDNAALVSVMNNFECLATSTFPRGRTVIKDPIKESLVRLIAYYIANNKDKVLWTNNKAISFKEYMNRYRFVNTKDSLNAVLSNARFLEIISNTLPEAVYKKNCEPLITHGKLFVPFKASSKDLQEIVSEAIKHALVRSLDVPEQIYFFMISNAVNYHLKDAGTYLKMADYAHSLETTIEGLFTKCGLHFVDQLDYYEQTGCVIYAAGDDRYLVISGNSKTDLDYVILSTDVVESLVRSGTLKTLSWSGDTVYIYINRLEDMRSLFVRVSDKEYIGGENVRN